ncbi:hypothetical protein A4X09_0g1299 [Tilletia walkeri]|uniref:Zn(2)-C6 fungal-type domain-containing protein n=1 Tax=Tilletia walkeri TaxID=117179 RepID=A0A8X7NEP3_9BASI|nr:hypothetical protein A4X09_0g1299 [Tilletia walkeri]
MVGPIRTTSLPDSQSVSTSTFSASNSFTPRRASCEFCRKRKIRCNGGEPCAACIQRKITCLFKNEAPKGRPPRSSRQGVASSGQRKISSAKKSRTVSRPSNSAPSRILPSQNRPHGFDIHPDDVSTPFWVQLGGRQGTVASALQDMWDRYFGPKEPANATEAPVSSPSRPGETAPNDADATDREESQTSPKYQPYSGPSPQAGDGQSQRKPRPDSRFPQSTFDVGANEHHWVAGFGSSIQMMIQGLVELGCNVYSQLGCSWIGETYFFVDMMQIDLTKRMFDPESEPGGSNGTINPLDDMTLDQILGMIEIFFAHNALAALFSKSMLIDQCKDYKLGPNAQGNKKNGGSSHSAKRQERNYGQSLPPPSPLLLTTVVAEAIPDSIEDDEDQVIVAAANHLRQRLFRYAESLLFSTSVDPVVVGPYSSPSDSPSSSSSTPLTSSSSSSLAGQTEEEAKSSGDGKSKEEQREGKETIYDLSTIQALVLIGSRELCEGTSPRKTACYIGVVTRMLSHLRAKERAAPPLNATGRNKVKKEEAGRKGEEQSLPGLTYRAVNEEIRINVEWFITAIAAWFFCQLERPLGSILPPASVLRFPPLRVSSSVSLQMEKRRSQVTTLRRQTQLIEQLWTCATLTVTISLIHDLHPSSQAKLGKAGAGSAEEGQLWQEERRKDLLQLGKAKINTLELCERIQQYLNDYLKDMKKNKVSPTALAFVEASFMAIYVHTLLPTITEADINWNTGHYFRKHTFDLYLSALQSVLAALEPWAATARTTSGQEMFSRRYEAVQKQLANIFVLALDAYHVGLKVIVEYLNTERAFGEGRKDGKGKGKGKCEGDEDGNGGGNGPARTANGWLMPTRAVLEYISANKASLITAAEQAKLASGSSFLRMGLHARRVEEGFTSCITQLQRDTQIQKDIAFDTALDPVTTSDTHVAGSAPASTDVPMTTATGPFGFRMMHPIIDSANAANGIPLIGDFIPSQVGEDIGSSSSSSPGGAFSIAGLLAPSGGGPLIGLGGGASQNNSYVSPSPPFGSMHSLGMGMTPPSNNASSTHNAGNGSGHMAQPFTSGDDPLASLWWNQQESALPFSFPTVTGLPFDNSMPFAYSSGWPTSFSTEGPSNSLSGNTMGGIGEGLGGAGVHTSTNDNSLDNNNSNSGETGGLVPMDNSIWGAATIPDSWLAATFYGNMEALRTSGFNTG